METYYKVVWRHDDGSLTSAILLKYEFPYRIYRASKNSPLLTVPSAMCFSDRENAELFYDFSIGSHGEIWTIDGEYLGEPFGEIGISFWADFDEESMLEFVLTKNDKNHFPPCSVVLKNATLIEKVYPEED